MTAAAQSAPALSPRLTRAMEAAEARGLRVEVIANNPKNPCGDWLRVGGPGSHLCVFDSGHIIGASTHDGPGALEVEAQTWAEHARVILAAADGVTPGQPEQVEQIVSDDGHGRAMVEGKRLAYGGCGCRTNVADGEECNETVVKVGTRVLCESREGVDFATLVEVRS